MVQQTWKKRAEIFKFVTTKKKNAKEKQIIENIIPGHPHIRACRCKLFPKIQQITSISSAIRKNYHLFIVQSAWSMYTTIKINWNKPYKYKKPYNNESSDGWSKTT